MTTDTTNTEKDLAPVMEGVEVTEEVQAAEVLAYLQEEEKAKENTRKEQEKQITAAKFKEVDLSDNPTFQRTFSADPSFIKNEQEEETKTFFLELDDKQIPITDEDQAAYMKAILNDTDVHLEMSMMNGQFKVECRAISVYESDLVLLAALRMSGSEGRDVPSPLLVGCAQQIRVAMQVVRINKKPVPYVSMESNRQADRDEEINQLIAKVDKRLNHMNAAKYGMLVRALNVFEHKLARMNALAYTGNFWKPVEID